MNLGHQNPMPDSVDDKKRQAGTKTPKKTKKPLDTKTDAELWDQYWPPSGWPMFEDIIDQRAMSTHRCPDSGIVRGMSYDISIEKAPKNPAIYTLEINEWAYDNQGHHSLTTPLLIRFIACSRTASKGAHEGGTITPCFDTLRLMGQTKMLQNNHQTSNAALVAAYIAARIAKGLVPDIKRILRLYKLV